MWLPIHCAATRAARTRRSIAALACGLIAALCGQAQAADLFGTSLNGANGGNPLPSTLYAIDTSTGAGTVIGPMGHAINGIAFDATTGTLYGSTTVWNPGFPNGLLSVNPLSGATTMIGSGYGVPFVSSIAINAAGEVYGLSHGGDKIVRIDKLTGVATVLGNGPLGEGISILAFDNGGVLKLIRGFNVYDIDPDDASATHSAQLSVDPGHHGAFHPDTGDLWTVFTSGLTADSMIGVTDLAADTLDLIDTPITYLHTLAFREQAGLGLAAFTLKKNTISGCKSVTGTVSLTEPAPAGGVVVTIAEDLAAATAPATVNVPAGASSKNFPVKTLAVAASESGIVSATLGGTTIERALTATPMGLASITLTPGTVAGGGSVNGLAKLECKAGPGPILVELSSTLPGVAMPAVGSLMLAPGVQSAAFQVTTSPVASTQKPKIGAKANGVTKTRTLTVTP